MEKLTLEHLAPYLPYGLKMQKVTGSGIVGDTFTKEHLLTPNFLQTCLNSDVYRVVSCKPILRPMSDIKKKIIHNGEELNIYYKMGLYEYEGNICDEYYAEYGESPKCYIPVAQFNWWLFEYHFDVFGLIEKGLAISIHDVKDTTNA